MSLLCKYTRRTAKRLIAHDEDEHRVELGVTGNDHRPSWKRFGDGSFNVEFSGNRSTGTLSVYAYEFSMDTGVEKKVMFSLDKAEVRALRDLLSKLDLTDKAETGR